MITVQRRPLVAALAIIGLGALIGLGSVWLESLEVHFPVRSKETVPSESPYLLYRGAKEGVPSFSFQYPRGWALEESKLARYNTGWVIWLGGPFNAEGTWRVSLALLIRPDAAHGGRWHTLEAYLEEAVRQRSIAPTHVLFDRPAELGGQTAREVELLSTKATSSRQERPDEIVAEARMLVAWKQGFFYEFSYIAPTELFKVHLAAYRTAVESFSFEP